MSKIYFSISMLIVKIKVFFLEIIIDFGDLKLGKKLRFGEHTH